MPIQIQAPTGYRLQPQAFQPISPASYFNRELPSAPVPRADKAAKAAAFGAMMKVLGELPGHLTNEYQKGRQRGLQNTLTDRYQTALKTGDSQALAGFQISDKGTISYDPVRAVDAEAKKTEAAYNRARMGRMNNPLGNLPMVPGRSSAPASNNNPASPVEPPLPTKDEEVLEVPPQADTLTTPQFRTGQPELRSDAQGVNNQQQLASFVAPAATVDSPMGPVTAQTAPPLAALNFDPAATGDPTASNAAITPAVAPDISTAAGNAVKQLEGISPEFLSASNTNNVPTAPVTGEPEVRKAIPVNQPAQSTLNGVYNNGDGTAGYYVNGAMTRVGIPNNMTGTIEWHDAPKKGEGFDSPEDAFAYAREHKIVSTGITQGVGGKWYLGASQPASQKDAKRQFEFDTPDALREEAAKNNLVPRGLKQNGNGKWTAEKFDLEPHLDRELAAQVSKLRAEGAPIETAGKTTAEISSQIAAWNNANNTLTDSQLTHVKELKMQYMREAPYQKYVNVTDGINNAIAAAKLKSGQGDKILIEEGQRILNPGTAVAVQTMNNFAKTKGFLEKLSPTYVAENFQKGAIFNDRERADYLAIIKGALLNRAAEMDETRNIYLEQAEAARVKRGVAEKFFPNPYQHSAEKIKAEAVDLSQWDGKGEWKPGQAALPGAGTPPPAESDKVKMTKGNVTYPIPKAKVAEFEAKGWTVVK